MPGGSREAYKFIEDIVKKAAAQVDDGPCVTYIGDGGAGEAQSTSSLSTCAAERCAAPLLRVTCPSGSWLLTIM